MWIKLNFILFLPYQQLSTLLQHFMNNLNKILADIKVEKSDIDIIVNSFNDNFPNENPDNLRLVCPTEPNQDIYYFSLNNKIIGVNMYYLDEEDGLWFVCTKIELSTKKRTITGKYEENDFNTQLLKNSCDEISYELYPFNQSEEIPGNLLIGDKKMKHLGDINEYNVSKVKIKNNMHLEIHEGCIYKIIKDKKTISGFSDPDTHFQLGDYCTSIFEIEDGNILVENSGDVSSIVIIKFA